MEQVFLTFWLIGILKGNKVRFMLYDMIIDECMLLIFVSDLYPTVLPNCIFARSHELARSSLSMTPFTWTAEI